MYVCMYVFIYLFIYLFMYLFIYLFIFGGKRWRTLCKKSKFLFLPEFEPSGIDVLFLRIFCYCNFKAR